MSRLSAAARMLELTQEWAAEAEARIADACKVGAVGDISSAVAEADHRLRKLALAEEKYWDAFMDAAHPRKPSAAARLIDVAEEG